MRPLLADQEHIDARAISALALASCNVAPKLTIVMSSAYARTDPCIIMFNNGLMYKANKVGLCTLLSGTPVDM